MESNKPYKRVLLKLSGEVLAGEKKTGIDAKVVGNLWIHNGKIIFLKASLFPIDPEIIACIGIIMEGVMFIKKSRKSCI